MHFQSSFSFFTEGCRLCNNSVDGENLKSRSRRLGGLVADVLAIATGGDKALEV